MINRILHSWSPHRRLVSKFSFEMTTCARSSIYYMCQLRLLLKIDKDNQEMTPSKKKQACRWCQVEGGGRAGRPTNLDYSRARAYRACSRCG